MLAVAPPAFGQSAAERETARSLMEQGDAAVTNKDYASALKAFQAADQIMHVPTTALAVARAQAELGALVEARDGALRVARSQPAAGEPKVFAEARSEAVQLADKLAQRIPSLTISVKGGPASGTKVTLDRRELAPDQIGVPLELDPGKHVVVATATGFEQARAEKKLAEGAREQVALVLEPAKATAAAAVKSSSTSAPPPDEAPSSGVSPLVYIGFGVGLVGVGVGAVTGLMSVSKANAAKEHCNGNECLPAAEDDIDSSKTLANISNVGFAVGLVGIGVGVYGLLSSKPSPREAPPTASTRIVEPVIGARFVGVKGSF